MLEPLSYIHSFWEGGAAAFGRIDEWSDIDLYLVVDDKKVDETVLIVEKVLESLSPIKQKYEVSHPPRMGLFQAFYRLRGTNKYLVVDLAVLKFTSPDKYLEPEIHGNVVFYFNKLDKIKPPQLNKKALVRKIKERLERLEARFSMFNSFVQKEINRNNHLEAIDLYHTITLAMLVEALRIRFHPVHHDFKMRYINYELPHETIEKLKHLVFIKNKRDLQEKYHNASKWFHQVMSEVSQKEIERLMQTRH